MRFIIKLVQMWLGRAPRGGRNFEAWIDIFLTKEFSRLLLCHAAVSSERWCYNAVARFPNIRMIGSASFLEGDSIKKNCMGDHGFPGVKISCHTGCSHEQGTQS